MFTVLPAFAQVVSIGYSNPAPVSVAPGQVITLFLAGLGPGDVTVTLQQGAGYTVPVLAVNTSMPAFAAVTVQIPYELLTPCPGNVCNLAILTQLTVTQNNVTGAPFALTPLADRIHFLTTCDTVVSGSGLAPYNGLPCAPFVTHADGSLVTANSPAQGDEELVAYATGLGLTTPAVATGTAATVPAPAQESFLLSFSARPNALPAQPIYPIGAALTRYAQPLFAGLTAGYAGLYQVNFVVPPGESLLACDGTVQSNLTVNMGGTASFDGVGICVAP